MGTRVVLVTGSTDGIGLATAIAIARAGCRVIVHGRTGERAERARGAVLAAAPGAQVDVSIGDFASLEQVRRLAADLRSRFERLHVLINNAGIVLKRRAESRDGHELTMAVNHLAPFLLTNLLLDLIPQPSRIVNVSSMVHSGAGLDPDDLEMKARFDGFEAYSRSRLANVLFTNALSRRLAGTGVTANALHPGVVATKLLHVNFSGGISTEEGARTSVYLALSPEVEGVTGRYFASEREISSSAASRDRALQERLWRVSAEITGLPR